MPSTEKHLGVIYSINSPTAIALLDDSIASMERTLSGKTYRLGQIGSFVVVPVGDTSVMGMVTRVRLSDRFQGGSGEIVKAKKEMEVQLIGSVVKGRFEKGIASFPAIGADVFMTDDSDMTSLFSA